METKRRTKSRFTKQDVIKRVNSVVAKRYGKRRRLVEIGARTNQESHVFPNGVSRAEYWEFYEATRSDLRGCTRLCSADIEDEVREFGSVVHIYVSVWYGHDWDLDDVLTIWLGTETESPVLLDGGD